MIYCSKCLQPDTRPNIVFSSDGVCPACIYYAEMEHVDWEHRNTILLELVEKYKNPSAQYDCIIGVSGGKDSYRQAVWVRDCLKLRPLLVCLSYPPEQVSQTGLDNISSLIEEGFDLIQSCPAPETWRKLMGTGFHNFSNWAKSTELALFSAVPRVAIDYQIPLILWGENPALQLGELGSLGATGYDGNSMRNGNTLAGGDFEWMLSAGVTKKDLLPYHYPDHTEFSGHNIQIVYLGWFLGDWSLLNNGAISAMSGFKMRDDLVQNTGDLYGVSSVDENWVTLNQMIKYYKFGFGKATEYANEMVRMGVITRGEGVELVEKYDGLCSDEYIDQFCSFIGITSQDFWGNVRSVTNRDLFHIVGDGRAVRKFTVGEGIVV